MSEVMKFEKLLRLNKAAPQLGVSYNLLYKMARNKSFPAKFMGEKGKKGLWIVDIDETLKKYPFIKIRVTDKEVKFEPMIKLIEATRQWGVDYQNLLERAIKGTFPAYLFGEKLWIVDVEKVQEEYHFRTKGGEKNANS